MVAFAGRSSFKTTSEGFNSASEYFSHTFKMCFKVFLENTQEILADSGRENRASIGACIMFHESGSLRWLPGWALCIRANSGEEDDNLDEMEAQATRKRKPEARRNGSTSHSKAEASSGPRQKRHRAVTSNSPC
jgi:hypothetical protein